MQQKLQSLNGIILHDATAVNHTTKAMRIQQASAPRPSLKGLQYTYVGSFWVSDKVQLGGGILVSSLAEKVPRRPKTAIYE